MKTTLTISLVGFCLISVLYGFAQGRTPLPADRPSGQDKAIRQVPPSIPPSAPPKDESSPELGKGDLYTLLVGVAKYKDTSVPPLQLCDKDAKDVAEFLETQKAVFKNVHLKLLLNEQATKEEIEKYLYADLRKAGKDDTVLLFFSGHGAAHTASSNFYFLTHNSDPNYLEATALNMTGLKFLDGLNSKRVLLIADACHAGGFSPRTRTMSPQKKRVDHYMKMLGDVSGRMMLTSSKPNEYSQVLPHMKNSVFTHYLLKALRGEADSDRDGVVTIEEAYDYVYTHTKEETRGGQHPQKEGAVVGRFPVSMLGKMDEPIKLDVRFIAQDPRCVNPNCVNPTPGAAECNDPNCGDVNISEGTVLYSDQNYQLAFEAHSRSYVYVYQVDSSGKLFRLIPDHLTPDNQITNPVEPGRVYWIPARNAWLQLDRTTGMERIYVVASRSPNARLENLYQTLAQARDKANTGGASEKSVQRAQMKVVEELHRTMGPTLHKPMKTGHGPGAEPPNGPTVSPDKVEAFHSLCRAIESETLDATYSVSFFHQNRR